MFGGVFDVLCLREVSSEREGFMILPCNFCMPPLLACGPRDGLCSEIVPRSISRSVVSTGWCVGRYKRLVRCKRSVRSTSLVASSALGVVSALGRCGLPIFGPFLAAVLHRWGLKLADDGGARIREDA